MRGLTQKHVVFIRVTKNAAGQAYHHLVESYRHEGKVKQRVLLSLGRVEDGKVDQLAQAVAKHTSLLSAVDMAKKIDISETYVLGPYLVLQSLFQKLGYDSLFEKIQRHHPKMEFSLAHVVRILVICRFFRPSSKLSVYEELLEKLYPEYQSDTVALHHLYRSLDVLCKHKEEIEKELYWQSRNLLSPQTDVVLYDLTTLRFESTRQDLGSLRKFGYSKEKRSDCTQVVFGLLIDPDGTPLGFEVYPGNTFEGNTLLDMVDKVKTKFRVRRFIFVADRGLFSKKNLLLIRKSGNEFIVGMRIGNLAKNHPELYDRSRFRRLADGEEVFDTKVGEDRCVVSWSEERAARDRNLREEVLQKLRVKLAKKQLSAKDFVTNANYRAYVKNLGAGQRPQLDPERIAEAAKKDGFYAIVTNVPAHLMTATELYAQYKQLWKIEDTFGELKGTLQARPMFHWTDDRIVGHLCLCFLALYCESHITQALRQANANRQSKAITEKVIEPRPLTAASALRELNEVRAIPVTLGSQRLWIRTDIQGHVAQLFQVLGLRIPPKLLKVDSLPPQAPVVAQGTGAPSEPLVL